jgi:hypothetical protein
LAAGAEADEPSPATTEPKSELDTTPRFPFCDPPSISPVWPTACKARRAGTPRVASDTPELDDPGAAAAHIITDTTKRQTNSGTLH